ncbi:MAG: FAD-dependent monooxygenase [Rhizobiales bacterium]|nr:FAD-dependent monooxygenase [Hyphomicrobiales bacterium]OJY40891.1 MAG: monooxygenase [Rhizobiales bacterium 64-17]
MKVNILGAGPAGLYLAILLKRSGITTEMTVYEQNAADSTFGFGVVFSDSALEFLKEDDPAIHAAITPDLERWQDITITHKGESVAIDGVGFTAVGRLHLLQILQREALRLGVDIRYGHTVQSLDELRGADVIVGADGVNSLVRRADETAFGTSIRYLSNRFVWFGTTKRFETLTQTFVKHRLGTFNAHHYRYSDRMSTFIIETDAATFANSGLAASDEAALKTALEDVFADTLDGHPLISNRSIWRQFPVIHNTRWSRGNTVILGDALHTAHFSIGSGTRLALEDSIALTRALATSPRDIPAALMRYEAERRPILELLVDAANASAAWYETFPDKMPLAPYDFAMSYITRSGRVSPEKVERMAPRFMAAYREHHQE